MRLLMSVLVFISLLACSQAISVERAAIEMLDPDTQRMLAQLEQEATTASTTAFHTSTSHAQTLGEAALNRFTTHIQMNEAKAEVEAHRKIENTQNEISRLRREISKLDETEDQQEAPITVAEPRFTSVAAETPQDPAVLKSVLADLKKERASAKGEEAKMIDTQIASLEKKMKDSKPVNRKKEAKKLDKKIPVPKSGKNDLLKRLVKGLEKVQHGGHNYAEVHALLLATLQEVRIAWRHVQAESIDKLNEKQQELDQKRIDLLRDACSSQECANDAPVPTVPVPYVPSLNDCPNHAHHWCHNSHLICSHGCYASRTSLLWNSPRSCHSSCDDAHSSCMQYQTGACSAIFIDTANAVKPAADK